MMSQNVTFNEKALLNKITGSVAENARKLGVSRGHLNNILKGKRTPSGTLLLKIQAEYNLTAADLTSVKNN
jgi:transcriptional regulator with XRE-family HTH domain